VRDFGWSFWGERFDKEAEQTNENEYINNYFSIGRI
jgi:hypothetical protein